MESKVQENIHYIKFNRSLSRQSVYIQAPKIT